MNDRHVLWMHRAADPVRGMRDVRSAVRDRFLGGTCYVLFNAAESEAMPTLVPTARIPEAVAVRETASAGASIIAPPLGGLRYDLQPVLPFAGDAVSYAVSAVALGRVRSRFADREGPRESGGLWADMT